MKLVANISSNSGLGMKDGSLLFHIKEDMKRFRQLTSNGNIVIMGRKTFESIIELNGKPLPDRISVVLTTDKDYKYSHSNVQVFNDVNKIIKHYQTFGEKDKDVYVIGGESIYTELLPYVNEVFLTIVNKHIDYAEVFYPLELQESLGFTPVETSEDYWSDEYDCYYKFVKYTKEDHQSHEIVNVQ